MITQSVEWKWVKRRGRRRSWVLRASRYERASGRWLRQACVRYRARPSKTDSFLRSVCVLSSPSHVYPGDSPHRKRCVDRSADRPTCGRPKQFLDPCRSPTGRALTADPTFFVVVSSYFEYRGTILNKVVQTSRVLFRNGNRCWSKPKLLPGSGPGGSLCFHFLLIICIHRRKNGSIQFINTTKNTILSETFSRIPL